MNILLYHAPTKRYIRAHTEDALETLMADVPGELENVTGQPDHEAAAAKQIGPFDENENMEQNEKIEAADVQPGPKESLQLIGYCYVQSWLSDKAWPDDCFSRLPAEGAAPVYILVERPAVRYCYQCGHIGEVGAEHRNCCPDGPQAAYIHSEIAEQAQAGLHAALSRQPVEAQPGNEQSAQATNDLPPLPEPKGLYHDEDVGGTCDYFSSSQMREYARAALSARRGQVPAVSELHAVGNEVCLWLQSALDCKSWQWDFDQREAATGALETFRALLSQPAAAPALALPKAVGVSRDAESPGEKSVLVAFKERLTDDQLRALHGLLAGRTAAAPVSEPGAVKWEPGERAAAIWEHYVGPMEKDCPERNTCVGKETCYCKKKDAAPVSEQATASQEVMDALNWTIGFLYQHSEIGKAELIREAARLLAAAPVREQSALVFAGKVVAATGSLSDMAIIQWATGYQPKIGDHIFAASSAPPAAEPSREQTLDFITALDIAEEVFSKYREDQPKWWKKMDGTPILNDVAVRMAKAFVAATQSQKNGGAA